MGVMATLNVVPESDPTFPGSHQLTRGREPRFLMWGMVATALTLKMKWKGLG